MRKIVSLLLILSLMIVPMQHLLAAQDSIQSGITSSAIEQHDHADHVASLSAEKQYISVESSGDTHCETTNTCKFCPDIVLYDIQSVALMSANSHIKSLRSYLSSPFFPELRPPRNA